MVDAAPVDRAPQARLELVDRGVKGGVLVGGGGFGANRRASGPQCHLDLGGGVLLTGILLVRDLYLDAADLLAGVVLLEPVKLFLDVLAEPFGDLAVATVDDNFHGNSLASVSRSISAPSSCHTCDVRPPSKESPEKARTSSPALRNVRRDAPGCEGLPRRRRRRPVDDRLGSAPEPPPRRSRPWSGCRRRR